VFSVMAFTVTNGNIVQIDALADSERLARLRASTPTLGWRPDSA
jgi:hypothetical protein